MKKVHLVILFFTFSLIVAFRPTKSAEQIINGIKNEYKQDMATFDQEINQLETQVKLFSEAKIDKKELEGSIMDTRLAYKKVEHFLEYFQGEGVTRYVNGAPLPKIDPSAPEHSVIPPLGLQTLDESIFADEPDAEEVMMLVKELKSYWKDLYQYERSRKLNHRFVFEAFRFQVIRIFTLGFTGFDTPGSVNAIPEAISSLKVMHNTFADYKSLAPESAKALSQKIKDLIAYLEGNNDFDSLDRLYVLRNYINPLYKDIYRLQEKLQIEFADEVDPTMKAVNYHNQEIFDHKFLNKSYYAQIAISDLDDPKKVELGKLLFYDPALSNNVEMACASCHDPQKGFTDGLPKSQSNTPGKTTLRNAPTLLNSVYAEKYFYDLREYDLERQVKHVVYDKKEFNMDFLDLADRLKESDEYLRLFKEAYEDRDKYIISSWSISNALAAYVASLNSWNSPFDQYARGETDEYSASAQRGFNLFMGKAACGTCHFAPAFNGTVPPKYRESESEVLGIPTKPDTANLTLDPDRGRMANGRVRDELSHFAFSFKTTTVRNAAITGPYMHNGVYETLDQVVDFYNRGGGAGMGIDLPNQTLPFDNLSLNKQELKDIVNFMETLTDTVGLTSIPAVLPRFQGKPEWDKRSIGGDY